MFFQQIDITGSAHILYLIRFRTGSIPGLSGPLVSHPIILGTSNKIIANIILDVVL